MCRENEDNHCGEPKVGGMVFPGHSVEFLFSETKSFGDERMLIRTCLLKMKMSKDEESTRAERGSTFTGRGGLAGCYCWYRGSCGLRALSVSAVGLQSLSSDAVKMVYWNKLGGEQLTKVLLPPTSMEEAWRFWLAESQTQVWHCHWKGMLTK